MRQVERILSVKMWLGLFDHPYITEETMRRYDELPKAHTDLALEAARKSVVLLKNDGNIPAIEKIAENKSGGHIGRDEKGRDYRSLGRGQAGSRRTV